MPVGRVPGILAITSGSLRRKTQAFLRTFYMAASSRFTSPVLRSLKFFYTPLKCQFSEGAVCCFIIPIVKNIRYGYNPLSPGTQDFSRKNKDIKCAKLRQVKVTKSKKQQNQNIERNLIKSNLKNCNMENKTSNC
ncbi:hypothetical protein TNCV_3668221 [Trichonephila clavipes]|nr:hypothetical protein TNCV_3668221 [Trichonephila clavipes]